VEPPGTFVAKHSSHDIPYAHRFLKWRFTAKAERDVFYDG